MTVVTNNTTDRRLPRRRPAGGDAADRAGASTSPPTSSASTRPRSAARTSSQPERLPADHARPAPTTTPASTPRRSTPCSPPSGYDELRAEQAARRERGDADAARHRPVARTSRSPRRSACTSSTAPSRSTTTARPSMFVGTSVHGQGHHTAFAMLASEVLGIPMDKITLVNSDTATVPRGAGTMGSRSLQTAGSAVHVASTEVLDQGQADRRPPARGRRRTTSSSATAACRWPACPSRGVTWAELAVASNDPSKLPDGHGGRAAAPRARLRRHRLDVPVRLARRRSSRSTSRPAASRCCATSPSTTAGASSTRCSSPASSTAASPRAPRRRCSRRSQYDEDGNPITSNLADYAIPSAAELPQLRGVSNTQTDSPRNPLGAKGIGESGTIGSTPAIQNAVVDAVSHLGVKHIDMPCTPERVWRAIATATA